MHTHDCGKNPFLGGGGLQNKHFSGGKADVASASSQLLCKGGPIIHARNDEKGSTFCQMMLANTLLTRNWVDWGDVLWTGDKGGMNWKNGLLNKFGLLLLGKY